MNRKKAVLLWMGILLVLLKPTWVKAAEAETEKEDTFLESLMEETDFSEVDVFTEELFEQGWKSRITFSEIVEELLEDGLGRFDFSRLISWGKDALF